MKIFTLPELDLKNKTVFLRLDLNVPSLSEDHRIREALPTIEHIIAQGAKVLIASHFGRPKGKPEKEFSLEPVAEHLSGLLGRDVLFVEDCIGDGNKLLIQRMKSGEILMLENLRFHPGEEKNDPEFARDLARLADVYVTDAFGATHRKHASTFGMPEIMAEKGMGFLIEKELNFLDQLLAQPQKPFYVLLGGSKVSDKIRTIESLLTRVQGIAIGGAMAYAFLAAEHKKLPEGAKQPTSEDIGFATQILKEAKKRDVPIILPEDFHDSFDIGPQTIVSFKAFLAKAKTVFWNGPVGKFEDPNYANGTHALAEFIGTLPALKVVGGGDTVAAIQQSKFEKNFDHLSTGGGAVLEYLEGNGLPGIEVLKVYHNRIRVSKSLT